MNILVTAFEPFGNIDFNTSKIVLDELHDVDKLLLPVSYPETFNNLKDYLIDKKYDLIVHLGMAASRKVITIENQAQNILEFKIPDNSGNLINNKKIIDDGKEYIYTKINIDEIIKKINSPYISKSLDAGKYLCNYLYYSSMYSYNDTPIIFIHIPLFNEVLTKDICVELINQIINFSGVKK